ncbi:MAG: hypothetical protein R2874_01730 [Desulfobacterales bacterium]
MTSRGFVFAHETGHIIDDATCVILEIIEEINLLDPKDRVASWVETALSGSAGIFQLYNQAKTSDIALYSAGLKPGRQRGA